MLPKLMTLSRFLAESLKAVPCGRMYPFLRRPESECAEDEDADLLDIVDGVETERSERASNEGHAPG